MSLLDEYAIKCVIMDKTRHSDGLGGYVQEWVEGSEFNAYIWLDSSTEAKVAEKQGMTSIYNISVNKEVPIEYQDFFKAVDTGTYYRVSSEPKDKQTPSIATIQLKQFTAERLKGLPI